MEEISVWEEIKLRNKAGLPFMVEHFISEEDLKRNGRVAVFG